MLGGREVFLSGYMQIKTFLTTFVKFFTGIALPKQRQKLFINVGEAYFAFLWWIQMYVFPTLSIAPVLCFVQIIASSRHTISRVNNWSKY